MLSDLQISNFAIIDNLSVSFGPGLTVITGETGAGKSILVNAINLLLGSRGSAELIRSGSQEATVTALFNLLSHDDSANNSEILNKFGGLEVLVKRTLSTSGRNRVFINDQLSTVGALTELCRGLVSISGQHEHQLFLEPEAHLETIDRFGALEKQVQTYAQTFAELKKVLTELRQLRRQAQERKEKEELRFFQLEEINKARVKIDEEIELEEERERLRHVESLKEGAATAHQVLYSDNGAVLEAVSKCQKILADLGGLDQTLKPLAENLEDLRHQVEDISFSLRDYTRQIQADPVRLEWVEERLHTLRRLMQKYGGSTRAVIEHADQLKQELEATESDEVEIGEKEKALEEIRQRALEEALELSKSRRKTASRLGKAVEKTSASLDMPNCRFEVQFDLEEGTVSGSGAEAIRIGEYLLDEKGLDRVSFFFSANPGEEVRPMAKIASGGELSRIVLALKELLARKTAQEILIFDEVDSGIGGRTADRVGRSLNGLAQLHQVICITHLPQIACYGDHHYVVRKSTHKGRTTTTMEKLTGEERLEEIARMLGGEKVSAKTRAHAKEMLALAAEFKT
ncbi:MAG: DNA repair protein RecN [Deltaproteobacteria bacterium]|nr:DNA repair protein RecN [Deltaproteobacteria bacterium]